MWKLNQELANIVYNEECLATKEIFINLEHEDGPISVIKSSNKPEAIPLYKSFKKYKDLLSFIYSPFYGENVFIYHYPDILEKKYLLTYDIGLSLDLNVFSYVKKYYESKKDFIINDIKISQITKLAKIKKLQFNYIPYLLENMIFKKYDKKYLADSIIAFNKIFGKKHDVKSSINEPEQIIYMLENYIEETKDYFSNLYLVLHATLLCIAYIELCHSKKGVKSKMDLLMNFFHNEIYQIATHEMRIAYIFFDKKSELSFFNKIQVNNLNLLEDIENMTWDLFHLRTMEIHFRIPSPYSKCHMPYFLTLDKALIEMSQFYKLSGLAYTVTGSFVQPFPYYFTFEEIPMSKESQKYVTEQASNYRAKKRQHLNLNKVIEKYKKRLKKLQIQYKKIQNNV